MICLLSSLKTSGVSRAVKGIAKTKTITRHFVVIVAIL